MPDIFTNNSDVPKSNAIPAGVYLFKVAEMAPSPAKKNPSNILLHPRLKPVKAVDGRDMSVYPIVFDNSLFLKYENPEQPIDRQLTMLTRAGQFLRACGANGFRVDMSQLANRSSADLLNVASSYIRQNVLQQGLQVWARIRVDREGRNEVMEYLEVPATATPDTRGTSTGAAASLPGAPGAAPGGASTAAPGAALPGAPIA